MRHHMTHKGPVPFTPEEEAAADQQESDYNSPGAIAARAAEEQKRADARLARIAIRQEATFGTITAEQAVSYINNKVTNLASAKEAMKEIVRYMIYLRDGKN